MISLRALAKKIAEANSKIIERLWQLFAEAKIVEFRGLSLHLSTVTYFYMQPRSQMGSIDFSVVQLLPWFVFG